MSSKRLHIQMLGTLKLRAENMDEPVEFSLTSRSRRLWTLVAYLIANRDHGVPAQELIDVLWPTSAGANPLSRLQNNVSRVRSTLDSLGFEDAFSLIRCEQGMYYWAPDYQLIVDTETFEKRVREITAGKMDEEAINLAVETLKMYEGDFLGATITEAWAVNFTTYYRSLAMVLCQGIIDKLMELERYKDVQRACIQALNFAPSVEEYSVALMRAYIAEGAPQNALNHYDHIKKLLHDLYDVAPSAGIEAERAAAIQAIHGAEVTEQQVSAFLNTPNENGRAFYCGNTMFREIAQLHIREAKRYGTHAQLALMKITDTNLTLENAPERQALHLKRLRDTISDTLRASDPFTKMSSSQLLVLLPGTTDDTAVIAIERVLKTFRKNYPFSNVELTYSLIDVSKLA